MRYDASCFYKGQKVGDCTIADANMYMVLMEEHKCATYALVCSHYLSPELDGILRRCDRMDQRDDYVVDPYSARIEVRA